MTRVWLRWLPAAVVPAVIAVGALAVPLQAGAAVDLPEKTPEQVLTLVGESTVTALSGTIEQTSDLGLPQLDLGDSSGASGAASALELVTGSHTARVYVDGPTHLRVQVMDRLAERDFVRNGDEVWLYDSKENKATTVTLPEGHDAPHRDLPGDVPTPEELAQKFLAAVDPSTNVTVGEDTTVAGRTAYDLVLTPRTADSLVESVSIAVDSETGLPLSVTVQARGQAEPAFEVAYTKLSLETPDADLFTFVPPPGATVEEVQLPEHDMKSAHDWAEHMGPAGSPGELPPGFTVTGTGWDTVIGMPATAVPTEVASSPLLAQATTAVTGGRLLSTSLVNVFLTDDGRVFVGSVSPELLQAAAAAP